MLRAAFVIGLVCCLGLQVEARGDVSFRNDVMAVLSRAGCNQGICHGNANGKGGFRLSLRGQDADADFMTLTRGSDSRRLNLSDPDRSLILLKATMQVPHEGGRRFQNDSEQYRILSEWIASGAPADSEGTPQLTTLSVEPRESIAVAPDWTVPLSVEATFSDGTTRDVTELAVYEQSRVIAEISPTGEVASLQAGETTVVVRFLDRQVPVSLAFIPHQPDFVWSAPPPVNPIDEFVFAKLQRLQINPSLLCDDVTFLRRAHLDLLGFLPTADEARQFVLDGSLDKRAVLIDALLERPEFASNWALKWCDLLRIEEKTLDWKGVQNFHAWLRVEFSRNTSLNEIARAVVAGRGSSYSEPSSNVYRALRDPVERSEAFAQVFLGVRLQCAKCHNHPFDQWTQNDYYGWTNLFSQVDYHIVENLRRDENDDHEFDGEQIIYMDLDEDYDDPRTGDPRSPTLLDASRTIVPSEDDRLLALADWIADPANPYFAKVQVNRLWFQLMGRGLVDPVDDFRATNPPVHPELLEWLAGEFTAHGGDIRHILRTIMNSRVYQLDWRPHETNATDDLNFSHAEVRRLTAEQILDSLALVMDSPIGFAGYPDDMRAGELPAVRAPRRRGDDDAAGDDFLAVFGKPPRLQSCECERSDEPTLAQTFQLVSGSLVNDLLDARGNRIREHIRSDMRDEEIVNEWFWTVLSRPPTEVEFAAAMEHLHSHDNRREAVQDLVWSLVNSAEFLLRR